jgi:pimeloyl-ACP methyl ester carboxylesterase
MTRIHSHVSPSLIFTLLSLSVAVCLINASSTPSTLSSSSTRSVSLGTPIASLPYQKGHANLHQLYLRLLEFEQQSQPLSDESVSLSTPTNSFTSTSSMLSTVQTKWYTQRLNHFDALDTRTYQQRYYVNDEFYVIGAPVFVYIGGEAELSSHSIASGEIVQLADSHNGMLVALEHRFYGKSQPFDSLATDNLRYLSSQQALADLAQFIAWFLDNNGDSTAPVVVVGGSYPGALSAWFRFKYPNIAVASVASSAPIHAKEDFYEYDQKVSASAGPECSSAVIAATTAVQDALLQHGATAAQQLKASFGCGTVSDDISFLYVLADAVAFSVQYTSHRPGPRYHLLEYCCDTMSNSSIASSVDRYRTFFNTLMTRLNTTCVDFSTVASTLKDTSNAPNLNQRQWYWQSCNEFGWFQTAPAQHSLRSKYINVTYHEKLCAEAFGVALKPNTRFTNVYYGGITPVGERVYFPNGGLDPWSMLSLTHDLPCCPEIVTRVIAGTSHCADLYASSPDDPPSLTAARLDIAAHISTWITEAVSPTRPDGDNRNWLVIGMSALAAGAVLAIIACIVLFRRRKQQSSGVVHGPDGPLASGAQNSVNKYSQLDDYYGQR